MKDARTRLILCGMMLVVLTAVLLPPRISLLKDRALWNGPHLEEIAAGKTADYAEEEPLQRLHTLSLWIADNAAVQSIYTDLPGEEFGAAKAEKNGEEDGQTLERQLQTAVKDLIRDGILPPDFALPDSGLIDAGELFLQQGSRPCSFLMIHLFFPDSGSELSLNIDRQSGTVVAVNWEHPKETRSVEEPEVLAQRFLARLGLTEKDYERLFPEPSSPSAVFSLEDDLYYRVIADPLRISIFPGSISEAVDAELESAAAEVDQAP